VIPFWYGVVAVMLSVYVVLDGFDFGAGILHLFVARTDRERREVLAAIGPVWDGNEVWLIASGGVLVLAFPRAYAVGFSGFYLPLMMVLWLLVLRGLSIELRSHLENPLWRSFWDAVLGFASAVMAVVLGAALGNVLRGVPIDDTGFFAVPLFTTFRPGRNPGVLDWYTVLIGVFAFAALAAHGALYLAGKTDEVVRERALAAARVAWPAVAVLGLGCIAATWQVRPELYTGLAARPWSWPLPVLAAAALAGVFVSIFRGRERTAFLCSVAFLATTLTATAAGLFPLMLPSTISPAFSLTAGQAATGQHGLRVALIWWTLGISLAVGYAAFVYRSARGRVRVDEP
jgi:cytochrome d ubiquinol oxidase subunit II